MNKEEYAVYRATSEWFKRRTRCLEDHEYRCQVCGCTSWRRIVDVHHLHYRNVGNEMPEDVLPLCCIHHEMIHNQPDGYDMPILQRLRRDCKEDHWDDPMPKQVRERHLNLRDSFGRAGNMWLCRSCYTWNDHDKTNVCCEICGCEMTNEQLDQKVSVNKSNARFLGFDDALVADRVKNQWTKLGDVPTSSPLSR